MDILNNGAEVEDGSAVLGTLSRGVQLQAGDYGVERLQEREMVFDHAMINS